MTEFDKINNYIYNKFDKLIITHAYGQQPKMTHNPNDSSIDIIPIIEKYIIKLCDHTYCCCEKSDIYI